MQLKKKTITIILLSLSCLLVTFCREKKRPKSNQTYLNLSDTAQYAGMESCRGCHANVFNTFIHTGMGQSFDLATKEKSKANFDHALVYDSIGNYYYHPYWSGDSLMLMEFRLDGKDTTHKRTEYIKYIVGSGQHTNSHIVDFNGYLYQAPITFYTQKQKWDLAPGFVNGFNSRFTRIIGLECMTCHNGLPEFDEGSENHYSQVMQGIDCERCHGPGSIHVEQKQKGIVVDTSAEIDYTIVNPANLSRKLQMSLCQRCHLQGIAVLNESKNWDDFKPGMHLNEVWNVFMPRYKSLNKFIMASQADRLTQSKCYINSELSCLTCHNPHVSVKETPQLKFDSACKNCHSPKHTECSASAELRATKEDNCSGCHMQKAGSIDIPHVSITDHLIRVPMDEEEIIAAEEFVRLECLTTENPSAELMAEGYLALYEKFSSRSYFLDSAEFFISELDEDEGINTRIHYYFLRENYSSIIQIVSSNSENVEDAWTNYRIGQAYFNLSNFDSAQIYFETATRISPYTLEFQNKLGNTYQQLFMINQKNTAMLENAKNVFEKLVELNPRFIPGISNSGYMNMLSGNFSKAEEMINRAIGLDPDYLPARFNLIAVFVALEKWDDAEKQVDYILTIDPKNEKALQLKEIVHQQYPIQ